MLWKTSILPFVCLSMLPILLTADVDLAGEEISQGMFTKWSDHWLDDVDTYQKNYGMAVSDVDHDGRFDVIVAGFKGPNLVLKFNKETKRYVNIAKKNSPYEELMDDKGQAIGLAACDVDGDGREEIYMLNTNDAYAGLSSYSDKLFKWRDGKYVDLFLDPINRNVTSRFYAGRSVACVDRYGIGKYGFAIASYAHKSPESGRFSLIEMDDYSEYNNVEKGTIVLKDSAKEAGIDKKSGGRGIVVGPILNTDGKSDIVFVNEGNEYLGHNGHNFVFQNLGNGSYVEVAGQLGLLDAEQAGRGIAIADVNNDGLFDVICANWDGPGRLFVQGINADGQRKFTDIATGEFAKKHAIRTVLVADFDNDGQLEILFNNIDDDIHPQSNVLFTVAPYGTTQKPEINRVDIGDAEEPDGYGTGGVYLDVDGNGLLDLLLSHGESVSQPIEVYQSFHGAGNNYIRIYVLTKFGAPARGASVTVRTKAGKLLRQVVDGGSGYLCQMEPVAHFGLGSDQPAEINIQWTDGKTFVWMPSDVDINTTLLFYHPSYFQYQAALKASNMTSNVVINRTSHKHTEL